MGSLSEGGTAVEGAGKGSAELPEPAGDEAFLHAVAPVVEALATEGERAAVIQDFARAVLLRVPARQLEAADPKATARAVAAAFHYVDRRPPGAILVRVTDPDVALDGGRPSGTVIEVSCDDRQFIVTTVREELHQLGYRVVRFLHPVYGCTRDVDGRLASIVPARTAAHRESLLQVELARRVPVGARPRLIEAVRTVLGDVFAATKDYAAMCAEVAGVAEATWENAGRRYPAEEVVEAADLLAWLLDDNFVIAGSCRLLNAGPAAGTVVDALGVLSRPEAPLRQPDRLGSGSDELLRITRTDEISTVHRRVPMHCIDVAQVGPEGDVVTIFRLVGVFSYKGTAEPAAVTPVLRYKLRRILELEDVVEGSQDQVTLVSLFQALPKDELFEADIPALRHTLAELLAGEHQHDVQVLLRVEPASHTVSALLSIPSERYTSALRQRLERFLLAQLDGSRVDADVSLGDRVDVFVRLVVQVDGPLPEPPLDSLEREVRLLCRTWDQELAAALSSQMDEGSARRLAQAWAEWFPASYRDARPPEQAADDVLNLEQLLGGSAPTGDGRIRIVLVPHADGRAHGRLKVFTAGTDVELSRFLPIIESLGLWAIEEQPYTLGAQDRRVHLHDFGVTDPTGAPLRADEDGARLAEAALALWHGQAELDSLNRLVLRAGMSWQDVAVLRAYRRYRSQVGTTFTTGYVDDVLVENGPIARAILDLFAARFDPALDPAPEIVDELRTRVLEACDAVPRLDHDRILRGILALVDATLRTNRYLRPGTDLALKFDSAAVPDVPRPVPYREIFVNGPSVEGIHLRWGPVARGGIRWSERPDDYRSEVLGLMRAQVLKNAVIVPTGAKGGFVVKRGRYGHEHVDVRRAYETFITGLLDLTDNVVGERVRGVPRRRDGDDPYMVVAADRGTAGFSDLANRLSEEHGFWLGDAFASGGSRGYDHKRLGITARGAWVAVRHHFAELGIDVESEPVTVAAIGDMSGDVFGNAMLQSRGIRLVAAFDHRDVFLDPDPNPEASYEERARLFALPLSSWQDYDRSLLSRGGGVWSRLDKHIPLSREVRAVLRLDADQLSPAEVIRAILQAPVDLLFAAGIGTFVRGSNEPDQEIGDRSNTEVRVTGSSIRARVVGEGANLAFTQRARIEYARRGGHVNTDAIDNSAGVDISDREVNLKILLRLALETSEITMDERDRLLEEVCEDVVDAVLRDCSLQSVAIRRGQAGSPARMEANEALMTDLESTGVLDRAVEGLPTTDEIAARVQAGAGLTRPEVAVLLAGAKRSLAAHLLASRVPDQPALRDALVSRFPPLLASRFDHLIDSHRLRRELIASVVANDLVDRMGSTFVTRLTADTGARPSAVAAAYWIARGVLDAPSCWRDLDPQAGHRHGHAVVESASVVSGLLEALTRDYLRRRETADIAAVVTRDRPAFIELEAAIPTIGTRQRRRRLARRAEALADGGADEASATRWAALGDLEIGPDVAELARDTGRPVTSVAETFLQVAESLGIDRLLARLRQIPAEERWSRAAWNGLADDLDDLRRAAARRALEEHPGSDEAEALTRFLESRSRPIAGVTALLRDIEGDREAPLDAVAVGTRAVRRAIG